MSVLLGGTTFSIQKNETGTEGAGKFAACKYQNGDFVVTRYGRSPKKLHHQGRYSQSIKVLQIHGLKMKKQELHAPA